MSHSLWAGRVRAEPGEVIPVKIHPDFEVHYVHGGDREERAQNTWESLSGGESGQQSRISFRIYKRNKA